MAYTSHHILFRSLDDAEEAEFKQFARDTEPENLDGWHIYHPVCRLEWLKRGINGCTEPECTDCAQAYYQ